MPRGLRVAFAAAGAYALAAAGASYAVAGGAAQFGYGGAPPPPPPPPAPAGSIYATVSSASSGTLPFALGLAFRPGDIPAGQGVVVSGATAQATIKSTWPDGSAKTAIVAGTYTSTGAAANITFSAGTASTGTALTTADLQAVMTQPVTIDAGAFGSASWSGTDWLSPFEQWVSGHRMSSYVFRKPIGSDQHLVAWLEVRHFSTGAVEVLPWVENGYLLVAAPGQKSETYTFTMGGTSRFSAAIDLLHHQRTPLISGTALAHWLGTDPGVTAMQDAKYLQATGLVPAYGAETPSSAAAVTGMVSSFTPLQLGNFTDGNGMSGGGFHNHVGVLPEWDVTYLTAQSAATYAGMVRNGYSIGRYPIHYREDPDFATVGDRFKPARLSNHTTLNIAPPSAGWTTTPATSGTAPPVWAISHQPSVGFLPYLVTGRRYFLDELQMVACVNAMIDLKSTTRENGLGIWKSQAAGNERHVAWCLRTLAQAIAATPDADTTYLGEFRTQFANNMDYYHTRYIGAGGPSSPIFNNGGFVEPSGDVGTGGTGVYGATIWMQDFITLALGYSKDLGLGLATTPATRLNEFFTWKAASVVSRFGFTGTTEFLYRDFGPYYLAIAPTDTPDWTTGAGPWYANAGNGWGDIYTTTYGGSNPSDQSTVWYSNPGSRTEGDIRGWFVQNSGPIAGLAAMAYCVKHNVAGAQAGWQRLTTAGNFWSIRADQDTQPLWSIRPHGLPLWQRAAVNQWVTVAGSAMSNQTPSAFPSTVSGVTQTAAVRRMNAWCGLSVDTRTSTIWSTANGGHGDYYGNEVVKLDLLAASPVWAEFMAPSSGSVINDATSIADATDRRYAQYTDGKPASRHSGSLQQIMERHNRALALGGSTSPRGSLFENVESADIVAGAWDSYNAATQAPLYGYSLGAPNNGWAGALTQYWSCAKDPRTECIYTTNGTGTNIRKFTPNGYGSTGGSWNGTWASAPFGPSPGSRGIMVVDTRRNRLVWMLGDAPQELVWWDLAATGGSGTTVSFPASTAATNLKNVADFQGTAARPAGSGGIYCPEADAIIVRTGPAGGTLYRIDPATYAVSELTTTGGGSILAAAPLTAEQGIYSRLLYVPALRGLVYFPKAESDLWFCRLF